MQDEQNKSDNSVNFEGVVLSGGGTKGILTLGALYYYYEKGAYSNEFTKVYSAASIGTVISLLLLCGYTPMEIFMEVYKTQSIFQVPNIINILDITKNMGVLSIKSFSNKIEQLIVSKMKFVPTLQELYDITNKRLIATVSNVSKIQTEYYTHDTHPTLSSLHATELSCCLPIVFHRMKYKDDYISDGGLTNNFPIDQIDDGKKKILAIVTSENECDTPDDDFLGYVYRLVSLPMKACSDMRVKTCGSNVTLIKIKYKSSVFELSTSEQKKMDMFTVGYQTAEYKDNAEYLYVKELVC